MTAALFIKHKTLLGKRAEVRAIWLKHMAPAIQENPRHLAYFYCFDDDDPDAICAFQQYSTAEAATAFLSIQRYAFYLREVDPLLSGPPQVTRLTPKWTKPPNNV